MRSEIIPYFINGKKFVGYLAFPADISRKRPAVLVAHAWRGSDDFARRKADALAELGYIGFAVDMYGDGLVVHTDEEALNLMMPLMLDRSLLQQRIRAAYDVIQGHPLVEHQKIGAIGFCFGGLTAIELLRSGADVSGVVSFHAVLGHPKAKTIPIAPRIRGALLMLHGYEDPMVTPEHLQAIQKEMNEAKVDWQLYIYGHTAHAFTNPEAHDPKGGKVFNPKSSQRAWQAMRNFFEEVFS